MIPFTNLSAHYQALRHDIDGAISRTMQSGHFVLGEQVKSFEEEFARFIGVRYCVGVASGTDAITLSLLAWGIQPGDEVITAAMTAFPTITGIMQAGARPVVVDITIDDGLIDAARINEKITSRTKAIIAVHLYGQCCDMDQLLALARERGLCVIEDAAQAWGAEWEGKKAGGLGDAAAFSFYPTKNLSAAGDAGMAATNSGEIAERVRMLRQHGMRQRYHHDELGWNARMDGFQGAVLQVKLKYIAVWNDARRAVAARYDALFRKVGLAENGPYPNRGLVLPREAKGARHVWHQYAIRAPRRNALRDFLTSRQIGSEVFYPIPLHLQPALKGLGYKEGDFPEAERAAREVLALPMFPELRTDEQETVVAAIAEFYS